MDDENDNHEEGGREKGLGDIIRRVVSVGIGAAFMTEESVKSLLNDLPLPKDIVTGLVQNAKGAKEDFTKSLREEFRKYLSHLDTENIIDYIAENYDVEVNASFKFKKKNEEAVGKKKDSTKGNSDKS